MAYAKGDSFGTFLESLESAKAKHAPVTRKAALSPQLTLLHRLKDGNAKAVTELMRESQLDFQAYADALAALQTAELVELTGQAGEEMVQATPQGLEVARIDS